jgi:hypothetical protein
VFRLCGSLRWLWLPAGESPGPAPVAPAPWPHAQSAAPIAITAANMQLTAMRFVLFLRRAMIWSPSARMVLHVHATSEHFTCRLADTGEHCPPRGGESRRRSGKSPGNRSERDHAGREEARYQDERRRRNITNWTRPPFSHSETSAVNSFANQIQFDSTRGSPSSGGQRSRVAKPA